jgi:hypothetical protein
MQGDRFGVYGARPHLELAPVTGRRPPAAHEEYLRDWKLVKRARFNAAKRLERKHNASTLAFAFAGVIGFLLPFYTLLFTDELTPHTKNVIDFSAYVTGALSLMIGLIEQAKDYPAKARRFDRCGRRVNSVLRRLAMAAPYDVDLRPLVDEYEKALEECHYNHDEIDFRIAKAQEQVEVLPDKDGAQRQLMLLKLLERVKIYGLYLATWILPLLVGIVLWWALHP